MVKLNDLSAYNNDIDNNKNKNRITKKRKKKSIIKLK